jgi:type VI secretion system protein ImpL
VLAALLAAWGAGLAVAAWRLHAWQEALVPALVQMRADALVRARIQASGMQLSPAWYRRRALDLMAAVEQVRDPIAWTLLMPGAWQPFDDLHARVTTRIGQDFALIVQGAVRRGLEGRAARLGGLPQRPADGHLDLAAGCQRHAPVSPRAFETLTVDALPEYADVQGLLDEAQALDTALAALRRLHVPRPSADDLRLVLALGLGASPSGQAARSLALFAASPDPADPRADDLAARLRAALACALSQRMALLHERLASRHALLALERALERSDLGGILENASHAPPEDSRLRLRTIAALLARQRALLDGAQASWMREDATGLGEAHARLLSRMAGIGLVGPGVARRWQVQADADGLRLRRELAPLLRPRDGALAWRGGELVFSARRARLQQGLEALLSSPLVTQAGSPPESMEALAALVDARQAFEEEGVPLFPPPLRPKVRRYADQQLERLVLPALSCEPPGVLACAPPAPPNPGPPSDGAGAAEAPASSAD